MSAGDVLVDRAVKYDALLDMMDAAAMSGRTPRCWEMTRTGIVALVRDVFGPEAGVLLARLRSGAPDAAEGLVFLGLPVTEFLIRADDQGRPVTVRLVAD